MRLGIVSVALAAVALSACQRKAEPPMATEAPAAKAATPPAPAPPSGKFDAISNTAMSVTGDLTASEDMLKFDQGQHYRVVGDSVAKGDDRFASSGATWSALMNIGEQAEVGIFRIVTEDPGLARNGGFCGKESATFLAIHQGADGGGAPALFVDAFTGEQPPGPTGAEANLCGTFMYAPQAGEAAKSKK